MVPKAVVEVQMEGAAKLVRTAERLLGLRGRMHFWLPVQQGTKMVRHSYVVAVMVVMEEEEEEVVVVLFLLKVPLEVLRVMVQEVAAASSSPN